MAEILPFRPPPGRFDEPVHDPEAGKIPPHDLDSEAAVISGVFLDESVLPRVREILRPEHFYADAHRRIWEAIVELDAQPRLGDERQCIVRVGERLKARGRLESVGGMAYLTELLNAAPAVSNVLSYAATVHDRWRVRRVIARCQEFSARGYVEGAVDVQAFTDTAAKALARIAADNPLNPIPTNEQTFAKLVRRMTHEPDELTATMQGYPTGLYALDCALGGLAAGHKLTVAASTGAGKTALAAQLCVHVAKLGVGALMFSTEVDREEVLFRALANEASVDSTRMKKAPGEALSAEEIGRVAGAADLLRKLPWIVDETPSISVDTIRTRVATHIERMRLVDRVPLGLVIVDYVQRLSPPRHLLGRKKHEQVEYSTRALKTLAQEFKLCVLELAQAKKYERTKGGKVKMPAVEDGISDSSQVAKEADEVVFLVPQAKLESGVIELVAFIGKQRGGPAKVEIPLEYHGALYRFEDPEDRMRCPSRDFLAAYAGEEQPS
jgi:replicative DNA helicase